MRFWTLGFKAKGEKNGSVQRCKEGRQSYEEKRKKEVAEPSSEVLCVLLRVGTRKGLCVSIAPIILVWLRRSCVVYPATHCD
jgi:hypothetical protein